MKINEIKGFPKDLLKKKKLNLYKAFWIENPEEEMQVNTSADLLAITEEAAVLQFIKNISLDQMYKGMVLEGKTLSFAVFSLDVNDLLNKELLLDGGEDYFEDDILFISLKDKIYDISVGDKFVATISTTRHNDGNIKISKIELEGSF